MNSCAVLNQNRSKSLNFFLIFGASLFISLCSFIRIPLFFTPVPLVIQNAAAVAIGAFLGSKKGAVSVLLFLLYGCCNVPVFSGGNFGFSYLASSPTTGYLIGYCAAAFVTGKIREMYPSYYSLAILSGFVATLICGATFLALTIGWEKAFSLGVVPFIVPDILKAAFLIKIAQHTALESK